VDNGEKLQKDAVSELNATATAYLNLKKQVDGLDASDQQKFADGLQGVADGLKKIEKMDQDALTKLQSGELGKAMAKQPGCQTAKASNAGAGSSPASPASTKAAAALSASASSKSDA
jgi:hypothetical protein